MMKSRGLEDRVSSLVGLPTDNIEPMQIVSYTQGQYFDVHHDAGTLDEETHSVQLVPPRRILTIFAYLNTLPEGQGHTDFPYLGLSVRPERGCAVLFCNLMPDGTADYRTSHKANPITSPDLRKLGVNIWVGDISFQALVTPNYAKKRKRNCNKDGA
jgi:hypothetical protein